MVGKLNFYNWFPPMDVATEAVNVLCHFMEGLCEEIISHLHHEGVDNGERFPVFISNEPSGASYRTFVYYAQMINSGRFAKYDYGRMSNK